MNCFKLFHKTFFDPFCYANMQFVPCVICKDNINPQQVFIQLKKAAQCSINPRF